MDYQEALAYISASGRFGIKLGLERTRALLDAMGAPDQGLAGVLVAGTNGKGSTCANLVACLRAAGYRGGSKPQPHPPPDPPRAPDCRWGLWILPTPHPPAPRDRERTTLHSPHHITSPCRLFL